MTGMGAFRRSRTTERIERSRPPGVSSWMTRAAAPSDRARSMAVATSRTVIGVMTPSIWRVATLPAVDGDGGADTTAGTSASTPRAVTPRSAASRPGLIRLPIGAAAA